MINADKFELWNFVKGYEGLYSVSTEGRVKSLDRVSNGITVVGKFLNPSIHSSGYMRINLSKRGVVKSHYVHVLIAQSFLGDRPKDHDVDHRDRNRKNNKLLNLRYLHLKINRNKYLQHA